MNGGPDDEESEDENEFDEEGNPLAVDRFFELPYYDPRRWKVKKKDD
jgi:hypothetical protein